MKNYLKKINIIFLVLFTTIIILPPIIVRAEGDCPPYTYEGEKLIGSPCQWDNNEIEGGENGQTEENDISNAGEVSEIQTEGENNGQTEGVEEVGDQAVTDTESIWTKMTKEDGQYKFIAPLGPISNIFGETADLKNKDTLVNYLRTWFKFLIGIGGIIGVVRLVMVGFSIITSAGNVNAVSKIKEELTSIITALVLVAGSWAFLNTINPTLVNTNLIINPTVSTSTASQIKLVDEIGTEDKNVTAGVTSKGVYYIETTTKGKKAIGPYNSHIDCENDVKSLKVNNKIPSDTQLSEICYDYSGFGVTAEELSGRNTLLEGNVYVNKGSCPRDTATNCTRIEGLSFEALNSIVELSGNFQNQPKCTQGKIDDGNVCFVVVTGGTEAGHVSHGKTKPTVYDLKYNKALHKLFIKDAEIIDNSFSGNVRYLYNNYWYTDEYYSGSGVKGMRHFHACQNGEAGQACASVSEEKLNSKKSCKVSDVNINQKICNSNKIQF